MGVSVKVLVLVLSIDREPWRSIERDGQQATWAAPSSLDARTPVRFYRGKLTGPVRFIVASVTRVLEIAGSDRKGSVASAARDRFLRMAGRHFSHSHTTTVDNIIHTDVPETYAMVTTKLFPTLTHVLATEEFDYLFRTNTSTYVDRQRLVDFAEDLPRRGYWGGFLGTANGVTFASGAGILMSRDCVEKAVEAEWDWALTDDVALGNVMKLQGIEAQPINRPNIQSTEDARDIGPDAFMWRCKVGDVRNDASIMIALHDTLPSND